MEVRGQFPVFSSCTPGEISRCSQWVVGWLDTSGGTSLDVQTRGLYILYRSSWRACERLGWWVGGARELPSMLPNMRELLRQVATWGLSWIQDSAVHAMQFEGGGGGVYNFTGIQEVLLYDWPTVPAFGKNVQHFVKSCCDSRWSGRFSNHCGHIK
jgi:hypothetical protein